jgi:hypothetical protein
MDETYIQICKVVPGMMVRMKNLHASPEDESSSHMLDVNIASFHCFVSV